MNSSLATLMASPQVSKMSEGKEREKEKKAAKKSLDYIFESVVGGGSWYQWTTVFAMVPLMMSGEWPLTVRYSGDQI